MCSSNYSSAWLNANSCSKSRRKHIFTQPALPTRATIAKTYTGRHAAMYSLAAQSPIVSITTTSAVAPTALYGKSYSQLHAKKSDIFCGPSCSAVEAALLLRTLTGAENHKASARLHLHGGHRRTVPNPCQPAGRELKLPHRTHPCHLYIHGTLLHSVESRRVVGVVMNMVVHPGVSVSCNDACALRSKDIIRAVFSIYPVLFHAIVGAIIM